MSFTINLQFVLGLITIRNSVIFFVPDLIVNFYAVLCMTFTWGKRWVRHVQYRFLF